MDDAKRLTYLLPYPQQIDAGTPFKAPASIRLTADWLPPGAADDLHVVGLMVEQTEGPDALPMRVRLDQEPGDDSDNNESMDGQRYTLEVEPTGIQLTASGRAGLGHGFQTLLQLAALFRPLGVLPSVRITDWPTYPVRSVMLDLGRSTFPLPMLKRVVRILARLKLNQLHLHLLDDELCGLRFEGMPFGQDNPAAMSVAELGELIRYAQSYRIQVVPELEAWGHAGSLTHHRPDLRGGEGMFKGSSLKISQTSFDLVREMAQQVVAVMPDRGRLHLGLDEALWYVDDTLPADFSRTDLMMHYHQMVSELGSAHGKDLGMTCFVDHAWRDPPRGLGDAVLYEPWQYWGRNTADIDEKIARFASMDDLAWYMAVGQSRGHITGAHRATRHFCRAATGASNCRGLDLCMWGWNDLENKLITIVSGAYFGWHPHAPTDLAGIEDAEQYQWAMFPVMEWWQGTFRDAFPDEMVRDRGPLVYQGFYLWGDRHGRPVTPAAAAAGTKHGHDLINEAEQDPTPKP